MPTHKKHTPGISLLYDLVIVLGLLCLNHNVLANNLDKPLTETVLQQLDSGTILNQPDIFKQIYIPYQTQILSIQSMRVELTLFNTKDSSFAHLINIPKSIIQIKHKNSRLFIVSESNIPESDITNTYSIPNMHHPLFCIHTESGGNWGQTSTCHVISLGSNGSLENVGNAYSVEDLDGDGIDEFIDVYTGMEDGLGYLDHASSPLVLVPVQYDALIDRRLPGYEGYYRTKIKHLNEKMNNFPRVMPLARNTELLSLILEKYVFYHLLNQPQQADNVLKNDLHWYDGSSFLLHYGPEEEIAHISTTELFNKAKEAITDWPLP